MRAIAAGLSDVGRLRAHNEDRFILLPAYNVFVVADGMGGHQSGEVASRMATSSIAHYFRADGKDSVLIPERLHAAVIEANAKIHARADDSRVHRGMGTTIVAAALSTTAQELTILHAGDSRCYRLRQGNLKPLTRDHSLVSDALLERPDLSESDLAYLPKNVITRALGIGASVDLDVQTVKVQIGDVYVLCSDGLHGLVSDEAMAAIIDENEVLTEACAKLIDAANANGGKDNITVVLVRIEEADEPWSLRTPIPPPMTE